jgi:hypothetical protein
MAYLVFPPSHGDAAYKALEEYRTKLYPFRQREASYRQKVGTASSVVYNQKVIANLDFMLQLSARLHTTSTPQTNAQSETDQQSTLNSTSSMETDSSEKSEQSKLTTEMPHQQDTDQSSQTSDQTATTDTSREDSASRLSSDRMSSSSAKLRNIEEVVKRYKKSLQKNEQMVTDRFAHIERHVHRMNEEIEKKLEGVQAQVTQQLTTFENRMLDTLQSQVEMSGSAMTSMNAKLEKLLLAVEVVMNKDETLSADQSSEAPNDSNAYLTSEADTLLTPDRNLSDNTTVPVTCGTPLLSAGTPIRSPEKKRQKSAKKKRVLHSDIRQHLQHPTTPSSPMSDSSSQPSMTITEDFMPSDRIPSPSTSYPDLESQYKAKTRQHKDHQRQHTGDSSPRRKDQK